MEYAYQIFLLLILFIFGVICLKNEMIVIHAIAFLPRLFFRSIMPDLEINSKLNYALQLLEQNQNEYAIKFPNQIALIRVTGILALMISVIGLCLVALTIGIVKN